MLPSAARAHRLSCRSDAATRRRAAAPLPTQDAEASRATVPPQSGRERRHRQVMVAASARTSAEMPHAQSVGVASARACRPCSDLSQDCSVPLAGRSLCELRCSEGLVADDAPVHHPLRAIERLLVLAQRVVLDGARVVRERDNSALAVLRGQLPHRVEKRQGHRRFASDRRQHGLAVSSACHPGCDRQLPLLLQEIDRTCHVTGESHVVGQELQRELQLDECARFSGDS